MMEIDRGEEKDSKSIKKNERESEWKERGRERKNISVKGSRIIFFCLKMSKERNRVKRERENESKINRAREREGKR